ncbi:YdcF family protein [Thermodesulfobacteriota bacterium]
MKKRKFLHITLSIVFLIFALYIFSGMILTSLGDFLVVDKDPVPSDAVVVLNTGMEYYPRLIEAASLYRKSFVKKVVINGNRKTDSFRELEKKGFKPCCPWYEERVRILEILSVKREDVIAISVEDAYDTISKAKIVGDELIKRGISKIILTTSKSHTRRARYIWKHLWSNQLKILMVAAHNDPYSTKSWWKYGRQIKWVLSEYGAWIYYFWKSFGKSEEEVVV